MKTSKKDFEYFKQQCEFYINKLGLFSWRIHYMHGNATEFANITTDITSRVATICLNSKWDGRPETEKELDHTARHEISHLLCAELNAYAKSRYVTLHDIDKAEESLVRIVEKLL